MIRVIEALLYMAEQPDKGSSSTYLIYIAEQPDKGNSSTFLHGGATG